MHMCQGKDGRKVFSDVPCGDDSKVIDVRPASGGASINPSASLRNEYYDVRGVTEEELRREIAAKGPEGRWWGTANTRIGYEVTMKPAPEGCAVDKVHANADSTMRLPRWVNRFEAPVAVQQGFDNAFRSLELHERGHVAISLDTAKELERTLREIPPAPTCKAIEAEAERRGRELGQRERQRQVTYDNETHHGVTQWTPYR
jgi:predicted secreted Zn-dependent protease